MKIKINKQDLLDFVCGTSNFDPIEKIIDPTKYEVFNCGIWSGEKKKILPQSPEYENFCEQTVHLRQTAHKRSLEEIDVLCEALMSLAPTEVFLGAEKTNPCLDIPACETLPRP